MSIQVFWKLNLSIFEPQVSEKFQQTNQFKRQPDRFKNSNLLKTQFNYFKHQSHNHQVKCFEQSNLPKLSQELKLSVLSKKVYQKMNLSISSIQVCQASKTVKCSIRVIGPSVWKKIQHMNLSKAELEYFKHKNNLRFLDFIFVSQWLVWASNPVLKLNQIISSVKVCQKIKFYNSPEHLSFQKSIWSFRASKLTRHSILGSSL